MVPGPGIDYGGVVEKAQVQVALGLGEHEVLELLRLTAMVVVARGGASGLALVGSAGGVMVSAPTARTWTSGRSSRVVGSLSFGLAAGEVRNTATLLPALTKPATRAVLLNEKLAASLPLGMLIPGDRARGVTEELGEDLLAGVDRADRDLASQGADVADGAVRDGVLGDALGPIRFCCRA